MRSLLFVCVLAACAPKHPVGLGSDSSVVGEWNTEEGGVATFTIVDGHPALAGIVDADGEVYEVRSSTYGSDGFRWVYHVPSTGYTVSEVVTSIDAHALCTTWDNEHAAGTSCYTR